jgi:hypothetical protein
MKLDSDSSTSFSSLYNAYFTPACPPNMVENEAGSSEAEESRDNPSSGVTPKGVSESALLDSDEDSDEVQSSASLNKSFGSSRKRPRLDLPAESTAKKDIANATEAEVPEAPMLHPAGSLSDQTPSHRSTAAETNLTSPFPDRDPLASPSGIIRGNPDPHAFDEGRPSCC